MAFIELPAIMTNLEIISAGPDDCQRASVALGRSVRAERVFVLVSGDRRHLVVAGAIDVSENDLEMFKSRIERF